MDPGILDEADAHYGQGGGDIQVLCGGLDAKHANEVGAGDVERYRDEVGHIPLALFTQQAHEEVVDERHDGLQDGLPLGDVVYPEVPGEENGADDEERHDAPADYHRLRDLQAADGDHFHVQLFFQSCRQCVHRAASFLRVEVRG